MVWVPVRVVEQVCIAVLGVTERVVILFKLVVLHEVAGTVPSGRLAVTPFLLKNYLFNPRKNDRLKPIANFDQEILAVAIVIAVQIDDRMRSCSRTTKEIGNDPLFIWRNDEFRNVLNQPCGFRIRK